MKKYLLIAFLFPFFSSAQECFTKEFPSNSSVDSVRYCVTNTTCFDTCNGVISITVYGDSLNEPYSYEWFNNATSWVGVSTQDTLCPGPYLITITDVNGNLVDNSHINNLEGPPNFSVFTNAETDPSCYNFSDGFINLTINGATPFNPDGVDNSGDEFYTYLWEDGTSLEDRSGLDSGIYVLSITDANGCNRVDSFELFNPAEVISQTISDTLSCIGVCDASGIVTPADGIAPYTYLWTNGDTDSTATNLCYGVDTVIITDANGCTAINIVNTVNPDTLQLSNITIDSACYQMCDGQLSVTIEGGKSPYNTEWSIGGNIFNTTDTITNNDLCPGNYQLIFSDANNCSDTAIIPLIERDSFLLASFVINDSCYNSCTGQITVELLNQENPPIDYNWTDIGNDTVISNLCADTFELVIIDARLCTDTFTYVVEEGDSMYFGGIDVTHNLCYGDEDGVIDLLNFNGGVNPLEYIWSGGNLPADTLTTAPTISNLPAGSYIVEVKDAFGCILPSSAIVVAQEDSLYVLSSFEDVSCFGAADGLIDMDIFGGIPPYFISWYNQIPDSTLIDTISAGIYPYAIVDSNGCNIEDTVIIMQPDSLVVLDSLVHILCKDSTTGEIHLTVTGGTAPYEYSIDGGASFQSQDYFIELVPGSYSIIIKDANECILTSPLYNITEPAQVLSAGFVLPDAGLPDANFSCFGHTGSIILNVNGGTPATSGYEFNWMNGQTSQNLNNQGAGYYSVEITDSNGCLLTLDTIVTEPNEISGSVVLTHVTCNGLSDGIAILSPSGGIGNLTIDWFGMDPNALSAGIHNYIITDDNGCQFADNITITEPVVLAVSYDETHVDCYGASTGEIDITVTGGTVDYIYDWTNLSSDEDLLDLVAGTYGVTITDANGCTVSTSVEVNEPSEITYTITPIDLLCNNENEGEILISASGGTPGYSYSIDGGGSYQTSSEFINLQADNYSVWIKDANGCTKNQSVVLNQPLGFSTVVDIQNVEVCNGDATGSIDFTLSGNTPPYNYSWSNGESTSSLYGLLAGSYDLSVSDANNCDMTYSYVVTEPEPIVLVYNVQLASCEEKNDGAITTNVSGGTPPYYYTWGSGESSSSIFNINKGTYSVYIEDSEGCSLPIEIIEVGFDGFNGCIEIPTGFTPNNDNIHDEWVIYGLIDFPNVVVKVYNRWGQEVFSSIGYNKPWDGKYNGVDLPTAAYYYVIELNDSDKVFNGTVTIKR